MESWHITATFSTVQSLNAGFLSKLLPFPGTNGFGIKGLILATWTGWAQKV